MHVKIVLVAIFVFVGYVTWGAFADGREAQRLADLGPCGLAQAYAGWRFEPSAAAMGSERAGVDAFRKRSAAFANAARLVDTRSGSSAQAVLIDHIRALASQELDGSSVTPASADSFLDAVSETCPTDLGESTARFVDLPGH